MKKRRLLLPGILVLAAVVLGWVLLGRLVAPGVLPVLGSGNEAPPPGALIQAADVDTRIDGLRASPVVGASGGDAAVAPGAEPAPLPPLGTPLASIIDDLDQRAEKGDVAAACRVAAEVAACDQVLESDVDARQRAIAASLARQRADGGAGDASIERIASALEAEARLVERCEGVPAQWFRRRAHLDLRAALLGDLGAAARFVDGEGMSPGELLRDPSLAALYRSHAWPLFLELYEAGDIHAIFLWTNGAGDLREETLISAVMPEAWRERSEVAAALLRMALRPSLDSGTAVMTRAPDIDAGAQAEADALFREVFAGSSRFGAQRAAHAEVGYAGADPADCESPIPLSAGE